MIPADNPINKMPEPSDEQMKLVAKSYAMRQQYWPAYTWSVQTVGLNKLEEKRTELETKGVDIEKFSKNKVDIFNKLNASFYHLQKLKENETAIVQLGREMAEESKRSMPVGVNGILDMPYEPIDYEYEALLVTLRSALDILAMAIAGPMDLSSDDIMKLLNESRQQQNPNDTSKAIQALLSSEGHTATINEFRNQNGVKSKRNYAVHQGSLPTGTINIQYAASVPEIGILKTRTMEIDGGAMDFTQKQSLDDYAENLFYSVCDLVIEALEVVVGWQLPKGERHSVYEGRLKKQKTK